MYFSLTKDAYKTKLSISFSTGYFDIEKLRFFIVSRFTYKLSLIEILVIIDSSM